MTTNPSFAAVPQVFLVVVKLKSMDRIVRIDSAHAEFGNAARRQCLIRLDPRERAEVIAKTLLTDVVQSITDIP